MSIETDLNRIATSLEEMVKVMRGNPNPSTPVAIPTAPTPPAATTKKSTSLGGKAPNNAAVTPTTAPVVAQPVEEPPPEPSLEDVHMQLRALKDSPKGGIEFCKKLMIKHGADASKPVISSIPAANYSKLMAEIATLL